MDIKEIATEILKKEGLQDWKIVWWMSPPSECIDDLKQILISNTYENEPIYHQFEILIHEITHCYVNDHNSMFYTKMGELLIKYSNFI